MLKITISVISLILTCSIYFSFVFGESSVRNLAEGKRYTKTKEPTSFDGICILYPDSNNAESTDGVLAASFKDGKSYGYWVPEGQTENVGITVNLEKVYSINSVRVHKYEGPSNYSPDKVTIYTSTVSDDNKFIFRKELKESTGPWFEVKFSPIDAKYIKVVYENKNFGRGNEDWMFLDEIQAIEDSIPPPPPPSVLPYIITCCATILASVLAAKIWAKKTINNYAEIENKMAKISEEEVNKSQKNFKKKIVENNKRKSR